MSVGGMVYIKRLTLQGFKSFGPKRVTLNLEKGLVAVTGPNGGGKSNIMDAIRFGLGELSAHNLRVGRMSELVHDNPKTTSARVSITLDNSGRALPIDSPEITITRKIDRSGESEYLVNGRQVSRAELLTLLSMANIRSSGFNIVPQGSVTGIAEMSGVELRRMLEEVSGIGSYEKRRQEAEEQLKLAERNLAVAKAGTSEVRLRVKQLERERNQAYRRKHVERMLASMRAARLKEASGKLEEDLAGLDEESLGLERALAELEEERARLAALQKQAEEELARSSEELKRLEEALKRLEEKRDELRAREVTLRAEASTMRERAERGSEELERLRETLKEAVKKEERLRRRREEERLRLESLEEELRAKLDESRRFEEELRRLRAEVEEAEAEEKRGEGERARLAAQIEALEAEVNRLRENLKMLRERGEEARRSFEEALHSAVAGRRRLQELEIKCSELERLEKDEARVEEALRERVDNARALERMLSNLIERIGASGILSGRSAREVIRRAVEESGLPGVHGFLDEWLEVEDEDAMRTLEAATSGWVYALVVDGWETAAAIARILSDTGFEAKIIPLETAVGSRVRIRGVRARSRWAERVLNHIVRDVKVSEKLSPPRSDERVAVPGVLAHPDGKIEVVAPRGRDTLIFLEKEYAAASRSLHKFRAFIDRLEEQLRETAQRREELKATLEKLRIDEERVKAETERALNDALSILIELTTIEAEEAASANKVEKDRRKLKELGEQLESLRELGETNLGELKSRLRKLEEEYRSIIAARAALESEVAAIRRRMGELREELEETGSRVEWLSGRLTLTEKVMAEAEEKKSSAEESLKALREELTQIEAKASETREEVEKLRTESGELTKKMAELSEKMRELETKFQELSSKRTSLAIRRSQIESELKRVRESLEVLGVHELLPFSRELAAELEKALEEELKELEMINQLAPAQYEEIVKNYKVRSERIRELEEERAEILRFIEWLEGEKKRAFMKTFNKVAESFEHYFFALTGGQAWLRLEDPENPFNGGVEMILRFPGKQARFSKSASGGEKSVAAVSLLLALQGLTPADFYVFDEVDAHMDLQYSVRLAELFRKMAERTQIIVITLKDVVAEKANQLIGVYMKGGESRVVKTKLEEVAEIG